MTANAKPVRRHQAHWQDNTSQQRSAKRRQQLNEIAHAIGYESWRKLETAVLNGAVEVVRTNPTAIIL